MDEHILLEQGAELMLLGMGTVFSFLALLVMMISLMSRLVARMPDQEAAIAAVSPGAPMSGAQQPGPNADLAVVLSAAIKQHRRGRSRTGS